MKKILFIIVISVMFFGKSVSSYGTYGNYGGYGSSAMSDTTDSINRMHRDYERRTENHERIIKWSLDSQKRQIENYTEKVKTFCSKSGDLKKCEKYCKNLKSYGESNALCGVKPINNSEKKITDPMQIKKNEWSKYRTEELNKIKNQKLEFLKNKEKFTIEKCSIIQQNIQNLQLNLSNKEEAHIRVYENLIYRIENFIVKFKEKNIDTNTLENYLAELKIKIEKFKDDRKAFISKFTELQNLKCNHSEGEVRGTLLETKTLLKIVHEDAANIRLFIEETILKYIDASNN